MPRARALFRSSATFAAMAVVVASSGYALPPVADGPERSSAFAWPASLAPGRGVGVADGVTMISVPKPGETIVAAASVPQTADASIASVGVLRCTHRVGERMRNCRFRAIQGL